jgi:hypothetical protein
MKTPVSGSIPLIGLAMVNILPASQERITSLGFSGLTTAK